MKSSVSIVAYTPCEVLSISREDLAVLPENMKTSYEGGIHRYPNDDKLRRIYLEGLEWSKFKSSVIDCVHIENAMKKKLTNPVNFFSRTKLK